MADDSTVEQNASLSYWSRETYSSLDLSLIIIFYNLKYSAVCFELVQVLDSDDALLEEDA